MRFLTRGFTSTAIVLLLPMSSQSQTLRSVPCTTPFTLAYCTDLNDFYNVVQQLAKLPAGDPSRTALIGQQTAYVHNLTDPTLHVNPFVQAVAPSLSDEITKAEQSSLSSLLSAAQAWDQARLDRNGGVMSSAAASTDLVSRAGVTEFVSAAVGIGALAQTSAGNTVTFHVNAGGLKHYLDKGTIIEELDPGTGGTKQNRSHFDLHNLDVAVAFDLNSPSTSPLPVSGFASTSTNQTISSILVPSGDARWSGVTARYAVSAPFDPNNKKFQDAWEQAYQANVGALKNAAVAVNKALSTSTFLPEPADLALARLNGPIFMEDAQKGDPQKLAQDFDAYCMTLLTQLRSEHPEFNQAAAAALAAVNSYQQINRSVVQQAQEINGYPLLVEYTYNRAANRPATHVGRFIASGKGKNSMALYTLNVAATVYDGTLPTGATYGRFRDVQASGQIDRGFGANSVAIVSGAFYYQYQQDPTVLNITSANLVPGTPITLPGSAQVLLGTAGSTFIGQLKTTVNLKSGLKIPFAFKWANRTDLINATDKVGQVGITYDFSSFSSLLRGAQVR